MLRPILSRILTRGNGGLGQGGGSGGDEKWLDCGHTLKVGPKDFPTYYICGMRNKAIENPPRF